MLDIVLETIYSKNLLLDPIRPPCQHSKTPKLKRTNMNKVHYIFISLLLLNESLSLYYIPIYADGLNHLALSTILFATLIFSISNKHLRAILAITSGLFSLLSLYNASRLFSPIYYDQVASVLSSTSDALSMAKFTYTPILSIFTLIILATTTLLFFISLRIKPYNTKTSIVVFMSFIVFFYFEIFLNSHTNTFLKIATSFKHYCIPKNQLIVERQPPTPNKSHSIFHQDDLPNVLFVMSEAISSEVLAEHPVHFFNEKFINSPNTVKFEHSFSSGPFTSLSAINFYLLTTSDNAKKTQYPTLFMYAKAAGYETHYRNSRNSLWGNVSGILHQDIDTSLDMRSFKGNNCEYKCSLLGGINDISFFDQTIKPYFTTSSPFFMTWHTDLVHPPYSRFKKEDSQSNYDAYLNGIDMLSDLLNHVYSNLPDNTILMVSADHGALHNHQSLSVPLFLTYNGTNETVKKYIDQLNKIKTKPVPQKIVITTFLQYLGYQLPSDIQIQIDKPISVETLSGLISPTITDLSEIKKLINSSN